MSTDFIIIPTCNNVVVNHSAQHSDRTIKKCKFNESERIYQSILTINIRTKTLSPTGFVGLLAAVPRIVIQWVSRILGVILSIFALYAFQTLFYHATLHVFAEFAYLLLMLVAVRVVCLITQKPPTLH